MTPQRSGRVIFDKSRPLFPLKASYDVRRGSILRLDTDLGRDVVPSGEPVPLFVDFECKGYDPVDPVLPPGVTDDFGDGPRLDRSSLDNAHGPSVPARRHRRRHRRPRRTIQIRSPTARRSSSISRTTFNSISAIAKSMDNTCPSGMALRESRTLASLIGTNFPAL